MNPEYWSTVRDAFQALQAVEPGRRRDELRRLHGRDPALVAGVESLLDHGEAADAEGFLPPPDGADGTEETQGKRT